MTQRFQAYLIGWVVGLGLAAFLGLTAAAQPAVVLDCQEPPEGFHCASVSGGTYTFSIIASPSTLNPVTAEDTASLSIQDQWLGTFYADYSLLEGFALEAELNEEGTAVTFTLREANFSDGSPVTMEDITYWYYAVVWNPNLPNSYQDAFVCTDGSPFKLEVLSENQLRISCPEPFLTFEPFAGGFLVLSKQMALDLIEAQGIATQPAVAPGPDGVLQTEGGEPFGPILVGDLTPAGDDEKIELATEEFMGLSAPLELLRGLGPFVMTQFISDQIAVYERNPHFWQVDSNGTQLPYLDQVTIIIIPTQGFNLAISKFLNGETDVYGPRPQDVAVILSQAAAGGFEVNEDIDIGQSNFGETFTTPNFIDPDPNLAAAARNTTVRRALYLAIDRATLVNNVLLGIGTPQFQPVSIPATTYFIGRDNTCEDFINAGLATAETCDGTTWVLPSGLELDVTTLPAPVNDETVEALSCLVDFDACLQKAKELLDSVGVVDTDGDGIREIPANFDPIVQNPGGKFSVQVVTNTGNTIREAYDVIICDGWNAIGVECAASTASFPQLVQELLTGTFTGYITIGLTGGNPQGAINVVPCGTALHLYHVSCDPNAPEGTMEAPTPEELAIQEPWLRGFAAVELEEAVAAFDEFQAVWMKYVPYYHLAATNQLFVQRTDRIANTGRAINGNTNVKFRCDLPGQSPTCEEANP
jgi:peptide/nickel transport system substrate-binding protein